ncbi:precursor of CEP16-like [Durio zibethinus]|uniref:Precursor of CEP16-like n=1 Tax=Durio zibethinus TaxID=66656 RepID=A0A6P6ABU3_DURZI|nr:precursor of CEP16-like [Durio zibethinus]
MGKRFFILFLLFLSLMLSYMISAAEARALPMRDSKLQYSNASKKIHNGTFKGLFLHAVKDSGPSPGVGHRYNNLQIIEVEKSGPSPGEGHK